MPAWPDLVVATSSGVYVLARDSPPRQIARGAHYGVTWSPTAMFLASATGEDAPCIVTVLDRDLTVVRQVELPHGGGHQALWFDGACYVMCADFSLMARIDTRTWQVTEVQMPAQYKHINSIWRAPGGPLMLVVHGNTSKAGRPSSILALDDEFHVMREIADAGGDAHNVYVDARHLYLCDSARGQFVRRDLLTGRRIVLNLDGFTRGVARAGQYLVVGASDFAPREARPASTAVLWLIGIDTFRPLDCVELPWRGNVHEVRALNVPDAAHHGLIWQAPLRRLCLEETTHDHRTGTALRRRPVGSKLRKARA